MRQGGRHVARDSGNGIWPHRSRLVASGTHRIIEGAMMSILSNRLWLEIIGLALGVSLLESAVTGKMRKPRSDRYWPVPLQLRSIFGVVGFGLTAFALVDFFYRLKL